MLIREGYDVAAAVTQPDRPKGRSGKLAPPPVKLCAERAGIPVLQPLRPGDAYGEILAMSVDLIVTAAYGGILKKKLLDAPRRGCINVHASLLPKYRGASPIHQALANGDSATGVTTMLMGEGVDTGDILLQDEIAIPPDMYFAQLNGLLASLGADTLKRTIPGYLGGRIEPRPQDGALASKAPLLRKGDGELDFTLGAAAAANRVRAFSEWPGAIAELGGRKAKILAASAAAAPVAAIGPEPAVLAGRAGSAAGLKPGDIAAVTRDAISVLCGDGRTLDITRLQFENGRPMDIGECWHNLAKTL
jgi:methionyl-tRNA formyltransferase